MDESPSAPADASRSAAGNKATGHVLRILAAFLDSPGSLGVSELSRKLGMTKSMVSRGVTTLVNHEYLVRDRSGTRYELGFRIADFGTLLMAPPDIHYMCRPAMTELRSRTGATISLHIPVRDQAVCIDGLLGAGPIVRSVPLGYVLPLHVSAAARVLLAFLPEDEIERYLRRVPARGPSARSAADIQEDLAEIRERGFAEGRGDYASPSVASGIAFPVLDMNGSPHASITAAGPIEQFPPGRMRELSVPIRAVIDELGRTSALYVASRDPVP